MLYVEGISLRACCSDGGVCNVGVGGGWLFSKGVGMFITDNTGMGIYFEEVDGRWWLADCFSNGLEDISLDVRGGDGDSGVRAAFWFGAVM